MIAPPATAQLVTQGDTKTSSSKRKGKISRERGVAASFFD
jgi:hypothetical protein